ncbi:MFS transporter [Streptomyces sp. NPDC002446]
MGGTTLGGRAGRPDAPAPGAATAPVTGDPAGGPGGSAPVPLGPRRVRTVFAALTLMLLLTAFSQTLVATALPEIAGALHGPAGSSWPVTSWPVTSCLLAAALGLPLHGRLGDLFGRKTAVLLAVLVFTAGSALAGWSRSMDELLAFRAVQGVGGGGLVIGARAVIADVVPPRARARYLGLAGAALGLGCIAGPLIGGLCADHASWRWCFALNVPFGTLALPVIAFALRLPRPARRRGPDLAGVLLFAGCALCLFLLAGWAGTEYAWDSRVVLGLGAGALGSALLLRTVEYFAAEPPVPLRLLRAPVGSVAGLTGAVAGIALFGVASYLPALSQPADGASATGSGLLMLPATGGTVVACLVSGGLISRTGHHKIFPVLGCALAAEAMWLLSRMRPGTAPEVYSFWAGVLGIGTGLVLPVLALAVRAGVRGRGPATVAADRGLRQTGAGVAAALFGTVLIDRLAAGLGDRLPRPGRLPDPESITPQLLRALPAPLRDTHVAAHAHTMPGIFCYLVPVLFLGLVLAFFLKGKPLVSHASPAPQASSTPHAPYAAASAAVPPARSAADATVAKPPGPAPAYAWPRAYPATGHSGVPVCGTVQHHDGSIVPRAALTLIDVTGRQVGRGATGDDGRYALGTPGAGSYVLIAAAGGHQPQAVSVTVGERPVELDVVLGGAGRLAGAVTTADGTPVRDAMVTLTDVRGEVVATTRSGREGGYVIGELVAGEYTLAASSPAYRPAALPVTVQASRETRQDIELAGGAVLRGTVRTGGGRPVEDARVTLLDAAGNVVDTATTGADGLFRFVDMSAGEYTVIAAGYPPMATVLRVAGGGRTERDLQLGHED